jgi:hypothetical protein
LERGDEGRRQGKPPLPAVSKWGASIGRPLQLLQDRPKRLIEQSCDDVRGKRRPKDSASPQYAEHIRGEHRPIKRGGSFARWRIALDCHDRSIIIIVTDEVDQLRHQALRCAPHGQEQWQP